MKTLLIGASGHVGTNLTRLLLDQGREVRVLLHSHDESLQGLDVERFHGDVLKPETLKPALEGVSIVHHLAAKIAIAGEDHEMMFRINVEGVKNVVNACLEAGIQRLVHYSSIHALSYMPKSDAINEDRTLALTDQHLGYDQSKALGEQEVLKGIERGLDAVILNPVGIIGPYDFEPSPTGEMLLQMVHRELPGLVASGFYWVDIRDVAQAAIAAETRGRCGERYILSGEYGPIPKLAKLVHTHTGSRPPLMTSPLWLAKLVAPFAVLWSRLTGRRPLFTPESIQILECHQSIDTDKAARELGFVARPLEDTIRDSLQWFADNGRFQRPTLLTTGSDKTA